MKKQMRFAKWSDVPPDYNILKREDLEGQELEIYDHLLPKLDHPGPDQLAMLGAYSYAAAEFKKAVGNKMLQIWLHRCMIFARNGLGLWKPRPVDFLELLLDTGAPDQREWPPAWDFLDPAWQITK